MRIEDLPRGLDLNELIYALGEVFESVRYSHDGQNVHAQDCQLCKDVLRVEHLLSKDT